MGGTCLRYVRVAVNVFWKAGRHKDADLFLLLPRYQELIFELDIQHLASNPPNVAISCERPASDCHSDQQPGPPGFPSL